MDLLVAIAIMCHVTSNAPMGNVQYAQKQCVADLTKCMLTKGNGSSPSAKTSGLFRRRGERSAEWEITIS